MSHSTRHPKYILQSWPVDPASPSRLTKKFTSVEAYSSTEATLDRC